MVPIFGKRGYIFLNEWQCHLQHFQGIIPILQATEYNVQRMIPILQAICSTESTGNFIHGQWNQIYWQWCVSAQYLPAPHDKGLMKTEHPQIGLRVPPGSDLHNWPRPTKTTAVRRHEHRQANWRRNSTDELATWKKSYNLLRIFEFYSNETCDFINKTCCEILQKNDSY